MLSHMLGICCEGIFEDTRCTLQNVGILNLVFLYIHQNFIQYRICHALQSWAAGCRWASKGWAGVKAAGRLFNALAAKDQWGRPVHARPWTKNAVVFLSTMIDALPGCLQQAYCTAFLQGKGIRDAEKMMGLICRYSGCCSGAPLHQTFR